MPRVVPPLTVIRINQTKTGPKLIKLADSGGLVLWIYPTGARVWRMSFRRPADGKPDTFTLGHYPPPSLAPARERGEQISADLANTHAVPIAWSQPASPVVHSRRYIRAALCSLVNSR